MNSLRPFFSFYGSKWQAAPHYPAPVHGIIVEPFGATKPVITAGPNWHAR